MKNSTKVDNQRKEENRIRYSKILLVIFQLRIFISIMIFSALLIDSISKGNGISFYLIYLGLHSPFAVSLSLLYKKKISFRKWYMVGAMLIIGFAYATGANPSVFLLPEVVIIFLLFSLKYIPDNFN